MAVYHAPGTSDHGAGSTAPAQPHTSTAPAAREGAGSGLPSQVPAFPPSRRCSIPRGGGGVIDGQTDTLACACVSMHALLGERGISPVQLNMKLALT